MRLLNKEEFLITYVLNRSKTVNQSNGFNGLGAAEAAIAAYNAIKKELDKNEN